MEGDEGKGMRGGGWVGGWVVYRIKNKHNFSILCSVAGNYCTCFIRKIYFPLALNSYANETDQH